MRTILVLLLSALLLSACKTSADTAAPGELKRYPLRGQVVSVDREAKKATIDHKEIEGFMPPMTMVFPIREDWVWDDLLPGSEIRAELVVDNTAKEPYWLEKIGIISPADPGAPPPANDKWAQPGQVVPDFSLTNQDGKRISINSFRGKALAVTFIYRECPLPEYCIQMSRHFSDVANQLNADAERREKMGLLSISFDPARDTPQKLKSYGLGYLGKDAKDLGVWQLAVGSDKEVRKLADFFGLRYEVDANDKTQFNHSLRTAVIGPDGKVVRVFSGNDWTPAELLRELDAAVEASEGR